MTQSVKNVYKIRDNVYTLGTPGQYGPRIERVPAKAKDGSNRGRPKYRRVRGGVVPANIEPETAIAVALLAALQAADKTAEA